MENNRVPGGFHVYSAEESGAPEAHKAGCWYFEPSDYEGGAGPFSSPYPTRTAAATACRDFVEINGNI